ncbi:MAG: DUF6090 family protein [Bacteroidota bacterium]
MIKFFRHIRKALIAENKFSKYLLYAIGEIILVVIGILIALQINNWQQHRNNNKLEKRYLSNLLSELEKDALAMTITHAKLVKQSETKNPLLDIISTGQPHDSLLKYFALQWRPIYPYTPLKSTFEEMKSSSHLNIIRDDKLREAIIKMYNQYESLDKEEELLLSYFKNLIGVLSERIPNIYDPSEADILKYSKEAQFNNSIRLNGAFFRRELYKKTLDQCKDLLYMLRNYQSEIND